MTSKVASLNVSTNQEEVIISYLSAACLIILIFTCWNSETRAEPANFPWMIKPAAISADKYITEVFPKIIGLKPSLIATNPDPLRRDVSNIRLFFEQSQYSQITQLMRNDPVFAAGWKRLVRQVRGMLSHNGLGQLKNVKTERNIYVLAHRLLQSALYYRMTGDPQAGRFLKRMVINTASLPISFWMHKSLRKYDSKWPKGQLETAIISRSMSAALIWGYDLFSEPEIKSIREALRKKGLYPMLRYLQTVDRHNNFLPAIASGAVISAIALEDLVAQEQSLSLLNKWNKLVEDDGSYGEQISYFNYACSHFAKGLLAFGKTRALDLSKTFPQLKGSLAWQLQHYSLNYQGFPVRVNFGDDDFLGGAPNYFSTLFLTMVTEQGVGTWMLENLYHEKSSDNAYTMIAKIVFAGIKMPEKTDPKELPLTLGYNNGIGIIRSGWTMDKDTVLAIRSGGGNRTRYSHDAPNRNAVALMYHGDYMLVEPGRASYRSKYRKQYDLKTIHHNTITLSNSDQLHDNFAHLLAAKRVNQKLSVLVSEAAKSYREKPQNVRRSVYYLHEMNIFIICDIVKTTDPVVIQSNWHFGNHELQSVLSKITNNHWQLIKPKTQLDAWIFSNKATVIQQQPGIMHLGYSYFPGDSNEGLMGNAFELQVASETHERKLMIVSIFVPQQRYNAMPVDVKVLFSAKNIAQITINLGKKSINALLDGDLVKDQNSIAATINGTILNIDGKLLN